MIIKKSYSSDHANGFTTTPLSSLDGCTPTRKQVNRIDKLSKGKTNYHWLPFSYLGVLDFVYLLSLLSLCGQYNKDYIIREKNLERFFVRPRRIEERICERVPPTSHGLPWHLRHARFFGGSKTTKFTVCFKV